MWRLNRDDNLQKFIYTYTKDQTRVTTDSGLIIEISIQCVLSNYMLSFTCVSHDVADELLISLSGVIYADYYPIHTVCGYSQAVVVSLDPTEHTAMDLEKLYDFLTTKHNVPLWIKEGIQRLELYNKSFSNIIETFNKHLLDLKQLTDSSARLRTNQNITDQFKRKFSTMLLFIDYIPRVLNCTPNSNYKVKQMITDRQINMLMELYTYATKLAMPDLAQEAYRKAQLICRNHYPQLPDFAIKNFLYDKLSKIQTNEELNKCKQECQNLEYNVQWLLWRIQPLGLHQLHVLTHNQWSATSHHRPTILANFDMNVATNTTYATSTNHSSEPNSISDSSVPQVSNHPN